MQNGVNYWRQFKLPKKINNDTAELFMFLLPPFVVFYTLLLSIDFQFKKYSKDGARNAFEQCLNLCEIKIETQTNSSEKMPSYLNN